MHMQKEMYISCMYISWHKNKVIIETLSSVFNNEVVNLITNQTCRQLFISYIHMTFHNITLNAMQCQE